MAIYRFEAKIISRAKGHSATAAAAYRTGTKIRDEKTDAVHDYTQRRRSVAQSVILLPEHAPEWASDTGALWNAVELHEKRKDAQLAREILVALPRELSTEQQVQLAVEWAKAELVSKGMVAQVSFHDLQENKTNPHAHIMCTMRTLKDGKLSAKKPREWNSKKMLAGWRESWAVATNKALETAGRSERVDHRSLADQGIDRIPEPKIGQEAKGMKERGAVKDPRRYQLWRWVKSLNAVRPFLKAVERIGEVRQDGMGKSWWERSLVLAGGVREAVRDTVRGTWNRMLQGRPFGGQELPAHKRGPDMER